MVDGPLAILGATSRIALDFIERAGEAHDFRLYARSPSRVLEALRRRRIASRSPVMPLSQFGESRYSGIINFIGVGDPSKTVAMGTGILQATSEWDERVLAYLERHQDIPYVFLSSGAVYGEVFAEPVGAESHAAVPINHLGQQNWYALAKLMAEAKHRATAGRTIIDIRVFNYISRSLNRADRFLVNDMLRAIDAAAVFETSSVPIVRDYLHPQDLVALVECALAAPQGTNLAVDAYTLSPIAKRDLLQLMSSTFGLRYRVVADPDTINATGVKPNYYSLNRAAAALGFTPTRTSAQALVEELEPIIGWRESASTADLRMIA